MITKSPKFDRYQQSVKDYMDSRLSRLSELTEEEVQRVLGSETEQYQVDTCPDVIFDDLSESEAKFYNFTGFTVDEFEHLRQITCQALLFKGRGRKAKISERDTLIILLHYLRRYPKLEEFADNLSISVSSLERLINKSIDATADLLFRKMVTNPSLHNELPIDHEFPEASLVVDATVQQINMPGMTFAERKPWFSGKHGVYCLKSQVIVNMDGVAMHVISGIQGSVHDLEVFRMSLPEVQNLLEIHKNRPQKVLADKGYVSEIDILLTPHKGTRTNLTRSQLLENDRISKHRVIVENFYGRLKARYSIIGDKYRNSLDGYEQTFKLCVALVNFEMLFLKHPLRKKDGDIYARFKAQDLIDMQAKAEKRSAKRKEEREMRAARYKVIRDKQEESD